MIHRVLRRRGRRPWGAIARWLALVAAVSWLGGASSAAALGADADGIRAEARLGPRVVRPDGTVRFEIEIEGSGLRQPRLRPRFELQNLEMLGGPDQEHGVQVGTGGASWRYAWTWYLRPRGVGEAAVTSIRVMVDAEVLELSPRRIQVAPGGSPGAANPLAPPGTRQGARPGPRPEEGAERGPDEGPNAPRPVFLHTEIDPPRPFVGQRTLYTTYLYTRVRVRAYDPTAMPSFDGCWAQSVDLSGAREEAVDVGGTPYRRVPIYQRVLYPLRPGRLDLGTMRLRMLIERIERSRLFFGPVRVPDQVVEESNPIALAVRPLPEPAADLASRFDGAVGPLQVTTALDRTEVAVGHGATLTVVIRGEGHLGALRPPAIEVPGGIDVIGPQSAPALETEPAESVTEGPAAAAGRSSRAWSYVLVPRRIGSWELPPVEVAYFDPEAARYRVASASLPGLVAHAPGQRLAGHDGDDALHSIRSAALPGPAPRRWTSLLPWAFGIPWVLALAVLASRRPGGPIRLPRSLRLRRLLGPSNDPRRALERLRDGVERAAGEDRPRRSAIGFERAWRGFFGETFAIPETVPVSGWSDALADRGIPPEGRRRLAELLEDLHYLRYAPELSDIRSVALGLAGRSTDLAAELLDLLDRHGDAALSEAAEAEEAASRTEPITTPGT